MIQSCLASFYTSPYPTAPQARLPNPYKRDVIVRLVLLLPTKHLQETRVHGQPLTKLHIHHTRVAIETS